MIEVRNRRVLDDLPRWTGTAVFAAAVLLAAFPGPAAAQGFGSPGVQNVGPPSEALFPDLAALQDRLEQQDRTVWSNKNGSCAAKRRASYRGIRGSARPTAATAA